MSDSKTEWLRYVNLVLLCVLIVLAFLIYFDIKDME